jgi:hypothetical protein
MCSPQRLELRAMSPRWETDKLPELVGVKEACEILDVDKNTLYRWLKPSSGDGKVVTVDAQRSYMIPPKRISSGPVWVREDVERFRDEIGRQRARAGEGQ